MEFTEPLDFTSQTMIEEISTTSPMRTFYKNKTILLTGGTGSLGTLYVQKLLLSDVKCIYLLVRPKREKSVEDRLNETFGGKLFTKLKSIDPNFRRRIKPIFGDLLYLNCGISEEQIADINENVEIVLHNAADVRFDEKLAKLLIVNLRSTRELLKISENIKKLQVFSYISTAYSHCPNSKIDEKFYEAPMDPELMIKLGEEYFNSSKDDLEVLTEAIIKPWPNTYSYTKSLSEEIVRQYGSKFPICIMRPSIVIATHEDPVPAWCDNLYGLNGVLYGFGIGVLRIMKINTHFVGDVICADFVTNSTLACIWVTDEDNKIEKLKNPKAGPIPPEIYQVCSSFDRPVTWGQISQLMCDRFTENPQGIYPWKNCCNYTMSTFWLLYCTLMYHIIPAVLVDIVLKIMKKPLRILPFYRKGHDFTKILNYFTLNEWLFTNCNMKRVLSRMSASDQELYPSDVRRYDFETFAYNYCLGLQTHLLKKPLNETKSIIPSIVFRIQRTLHVFILFIYYGSHIALFYLIATKMGLLEYIKNSATDTYELFKNPPQFQI